MHFARVGRTGEIVEASEKISRAFNYYCPHCGGRVSPRIGEQREPHFAHHPNEGQPECDEYFPSTWGQSTETVSRLRREIEDSPDEIGLCLEDAGDDWTLYLRLPEIPNEELGSVSLSSLTAARVEVYSGDAVVATLLALDLRPGVGSARVRVSPTSHQYYVAPQGSWPSTVNSQRWRLSSNGLTPIGTLFRFRRGEWTRLRPHSLVEWGERLYIVADHRVSLPHACTPVWVASVSAGSLTWGLWRILLPSEPTHDVEQWLERLHHPIAPPRWRIEVLSVPNAVDVKQRVPCFVRGLPIVGKIIAPYPGATSHIMLSSGSNQHWITVHPDPKNGESFFAVSVATRGRCSLHVGGERETAVEFNCNDEADINDLRKALANLPRLRVWIGESCFEPWSSEMPVLTVNRRADVPKLRIEPGIERVRLHVLFWGADAPPVPKYLSTREAERVVLDLLSKLQPGRLRLDAGALGSIEFTVRVARKAKKYYRASRIAAWLACASTTQVNCTSPAMAPAVIRRVGNDARLLVASVRSTNPVVTTQLRAVARERTSSGRRRAQ